jgi:hypothetical protein
MKTVHVTHRSAQRTAAEWAVQNTRLTQYENEAMKFHDFMEELVSMKPDEPLALHYGPHSFFLIKKPNKEPTHGS